MKIYKNITYLVETSDGLEQTNRVSNKVKTESKILTHDDDILNLTIMERKKHNIPEQGLSLENDDWNKILDIRLNVLNDITESIQKKEEYFMHNILNIGFLIVSNIYIVRDYQNFLTELITDRETMTDITKDKELDGLSNWIGILFGYPLKKKEFHDWIDNNWEKIEQVFPTDFHRFEKSTSLFDIGEEIMKLKPKNSYKEIADILSYKYPNDSRVLDIGWLKTTLHRHKKLISSIK